MSLQIKTIKILIKKKLENILNKFFLEKYRYMQTSDYVFMSNKFMC